MRPASAEYTAMNAPAPPTGPGPGSALDPGLVEDPDRLACLVADAAGGDESAWESIVVMYSRRIYAMAKSRLRDAESAEEITQSVFATLAERLRGPGGYTEKGRFEPWLFRIAMNRVRDEGRRRQRQSQRTVRFADPDADGVAAAAARSDGAADERADELASLREAIGRLDERDREIVELRHHCGLSFAQIAESLDEPMGTVLARHHRALKKIKKDMETSNRPPAAGAGDGDRGEADDAR